MIEVTRCPFQSKHKPPVSNIRATAFVGSTSNLGLGLLFVPLRH